MGGRAITTYDERDNPIELRIVSADGGVFRQVVRKYDASGRLEEEKTLQQNDGLLFLDRLTPVQKAALTPEQAQAFAQPPETRYKYDAQGRLIEKQQRNKPFDRTTTIDYNDRGDIARELDTFQGNRVLSDVRYSYQYDSFNNWTEKVVTRNIGSGSMTLTTRRTITYY